MDAMNKLEELDNYFITLKYFLYDLIKKPGQLFDTDETRMTIEHRCPRVLARNQQTKLWYCTLGNNPQVTVVACIINAIGQALPPFVPRMPRISFWTGQKGKFPQICMVSVRMDESIWFFLKNDFPIISLIMQDQAYLYCY